MNKPKDPRNSIPDLLETKEWKEKVDKVSVYLYYHLQPTSALTYPLFPAECFHQNIFYLFEERNKKLKKNKKLKLQDEFPQHVKILFV